MYLVKTTKPLLYPEQQKQYSAVFAFILLLFILGSVFLLANLANGKLEAERVQGIWTKAPESTPR